MAGGDELDGDRGADTLRGEDGADVLRGDTASETGAGDVYSGGGDVDEVFFPSNECDVQLITCSPRDLVITIDNQANDGAAGENDDVRDDVEDISITTIFQGSGGAGRANLTGSAAFNVIAGSPQGDLIDPAGGSDIVWANDGDDVVQARDGSPDRVECGPGNDTANVDQFDLVLGCETVDRVDIAFALEDRPPALTLVTPDAGATLDPNTPTVLRAEASDDRGIKHVLFMDDERVLCRDEEPPYECGYAPRGEDVRTNTLSVAAVDTSDQATFLARSVGVAKFRATQLTAAVGRRRDRRRPYRFAVSGQLQLPPALTPALGCSGVVTITVQARRRTLVTRRVKLSPTCGYRATIRVRGKKRLGIGARFGGNAFVNEAASPPTGARSG